MWMLTMWKCCQSPMPLLPIANWRLALVALATFSLALPAHAEGGYTNHAGNVVAGWPVKLTATHVTLAERGSSDLNAQRSTLNPQRSTLNAQPPTLNPQPSTLNPQHLSPITYHLSSITYPLSIFPESERRRIAADFGQPRVPRAVKRAIAGAEKAMARARKRAEKGLCTKDESDDFCAKSAAALRRYLDKQVESGTITPAERKALGW